MKQREGEVHTEGEEEVARESDEEETSAIKQQVIHMMWTGV